MDPAWPVSPSSHWIAPAGQVLPPACPALPSALTAYHVVRGDPKAIPYLVRDVLVRALLIGAGLYVAGERKRVPRKALIASAFIETFVLGFEFYAQRSAAR